MKNLQPIPEAIAAIAEQLPPRTPTRRELLEQGASVELIAVLESAGKVAPTEGSQQ